MPRAAAVALFALLVPTGAHATMISGWDVTAKPDDKGLCSIQHNYQDAADGSATTSVNLVFGKGDNGAPVLVIALGYSKWAYTKGDKRTADLMIDDAVEQRAVRWEVTDPHVLLAVIEKPDALLQPISRGKELRLRFDGGNDAEAAFEVPDIGQAIGAVQACRDQAK